jgi:hypothetical protein
VDATSVDARPEVSRDEFVELAATVHDLAQRISLLEHPPGALEHSPAVAPADSISPPILAFSSDLVPAIGRSLLAIAGAYLLRLLSELAILPPRVGIAAGIVYAAIWLWLATRSRKKLTVTLYAIASMLILAPLLWEATVRLHAGPAWIAALIVAVFAIGGCSNKSIAVISTTACALIAMVLLIALHDLVPFTLALLAIAAAAEFSGVSSRWVVAFFVDGAVAIFTIIIAKGLPEGYAPASVSAAVVTQVLLLTIYAGSIYPRRRAYSVFEIIQAISALVLAAGGAWYLTHANTTIACCLLLGSSLCYALTLLGSAPERNRRLLAVFSLALALGGTYLLASGIALAAIWCTLAVGVVSFGRISFQSPFYLWGATLLSSLAIQSATRVWDGSIGPFPFVEAAIVFCAGLASYALMARSQQRFLALVVIANCVFVGVSLACSVVPGALVLVVAAVILAAIGGRTGRRELVWIMYPLMLLAAAKILLHDSWQESTLSLVISLLIYGFALILLPRVLNGQRRASNRATL